MATDPMKCLMLCRYGRTVVRLSQHPLPRAIFAAAIVVGTLTGACNAPQAQDIAAETSRKTEQSAIAAMIDETPIPVDLVQLRVRQAVGERQVTDQARELLQAEALEKLIDQQKVLVQLQQRGEACTDKELEVALQRLHNDMERQEKTLDDYLHSLAISPASLRRMMQWQLSWRRCLGKYLTDENLQRYFERHHRDFDGTTLHVAQVLLRPTAEWDRDECLLKAKKIREEIVSGKLAFADAARKYSQAPSAKQGGNLDWIGRHEPMPELFSRAAFQLDAGEVSVPVVSPYGVHLIQCIEIKPGQKDWQQVRKPLRNAVSAYLFRWLADRPDPKHVVRYTGAIPHFQPGTRVLATDAVKEERE